MIPHWMTDASGILAPLVAVGWLVVQLQTKNAILSMSAVIAEKIGAVSTQIIAHEAADAEVHKAIDGRLERIEQKV